MRINIKKNALEKVLKVANDVCTVSQAITTECIYIEANKEQNQIIFKFYNLSLKVQYILDTDFTIEESGATLIKTRMLYDITNTLPNQEIQLVLVENNWLHIQQGSFETNIVTLDPSLFIELINRIDESWEHFELNSNIFRSIKNKLYHSCADIKDITKANYKMLTGIQFDSKTVDGKLNIVACNSKKISVLTYDFSGSKFNITLDQATINFIISNTNENQNVTIYFDGTYVDYRIGNIIVRSKLIDGSFPDTNKFFSSTESICSYKISTKALVNAIDRGQVIVQSNKNPTVDMYANNDTLSISFKSQEVGNLNDVLPISNFSGISERITVSIKFLSSILKSFGDAEITINYVNTNNMVSKIILYDEKDENYKQLLALFRSESNPRPA